jgi:hypothetical protein
VHTAALLLGSIDSSYDTKGRSRVRYKANFAKILSRREINEQVLEDGMRIVRRVDRAEQQFDEPHLWGQLYAAGAHHLVLLDFIVSYQFAQIGNDLKAQAFLGELDNHPAIGGLIDSTSNYEVEQDEMSRSSRATI